MVKYFLHTTLIAAREADKFDFTIRKVILLQASGRYVSFRQTMVNNPRVVLTSSSFMNVKKLHSSMPLGARGVYYSVVSENLKCVWHHRIFFLKVKYFVLCSAAPVQA